jgi:Peptidase_C39 like family
MSEDPEYFLFYMPDYVLEEEAQTRTSSTWTWAWVCIGLLLLVYLVFGPLSGLFSQTGNSPGSGTNRPANTGQQPASYNASEHLVRLSQLDPSQYASQSEFTIWAYSACSTTSLTEVMNAYGRHYRITDVLKVEASVGAITPPLGLLNDEGIQKTAAQFGFKTKWGHNLTLDQIIAIANQGHPVIVSFPPDRYAGGHLLVVTGGNSSLVKLADSSLWNRHSLSRSQFLAWWEGFYAIVTPT